MLLPDLLAPNDPSVVLYRSLEISTLSLYLFLPFLRVSRQSRGTLRIYLSTILALNSIDLYDLAIMQMTN